MIDALACIALAIYFEARGEPETGQEAVGHVIMNRVASPHFPATACDVVTENRRPGTKLCQFSFWCDGYPDTPRDRSAYMQALLIATAVVDGDIPDPTGGATHYHADYVAPNWTGLTQVAQIGRHLFYRKEP